MLSVAILISLILLFKYIRLAHRVPWHFIGKARFQSAIDTEELVKLFFSFPLAPNWRGKWQPTPVFLPGKFHGQRSLAGYSPWGCKESDMTQHEHLTVTRIP